MTTRKWTYSPTGWVFLLAAIALLCVGLPYVLQFSHNDVSKDPTHWGLLGDYVGGLLNPLLSFLSLLIVCLTLIQQSAESSQTAERETVRDFESCLFSLLQLHRGNLLSIDLWQDAQIDDRGNKLREPRETHGRDCFVVFLKWIQKNFERAQSKTIEERLLEAYSVFYDEHMRKAEVGHYFRHLYHVFKYVDESTFIDSAQKRRYAKLVRAQLSIPESSLLFFNSFHPLGRNFRDYIKRYALLQDLSAADLNLPGVDDGELRRLLGRDSFFDS